MRNGRSCRPELHELEGRTLLSAPTAYHGEINTANPLIKSSHPVVQNGQMTALVLTFTHNMNQWTTSDLGNYAAAAEVGGNPNYQDDPIPLTSAIYDPGTHTVTLTPAQPVPVAGVASFNVYSPIPSDTPITDTSGHLLDGYGDGKANGLLSIKMNPKGVTLGPQVHRHRVIENISANAGTTVGHLFDSITGIISPWTYLKAALPHHHNTPPPRKR